MKCKLCNREAVNEEYCELHERARKNIVEKFEIWKQALNISWEEYLSEVTKNPYAGEWAKEVAEALLKNKK